MSEEFNPQAFAKRLKTLGIAPTLLQEPVQPGNTVRYSKPRCSTDSRLHTLPELNLQDTVDKGTDPDFISIQTLGEGGMGKVRLATQVVLDREVAVKTVHEDHSDEVAQALLEEAYITGYLEHPNIVPIYTVGRTSQGAPLIVMKRIEGTSWLEKLDAQPLATKPAELREALEVLSQVANAVDFAHSKGILHRDIKTENVMIGEFGEVYLVDWGIAVSLDNQRTLLPYRGDDDRICGTPGYMAPEMVRQHIDKIDERTDVYLLGATLHEILTGKTRHTGESVVQILYSAHESPPFDYDDDVPKELAQIANKACSVKRADRFRSAREFREAIQQYLSHRESVAISSSASAKVRELEDLLDQGASDIQRLNDIYVESRFGFQQALRMWPENEDAHRGLQACVERMLTHHLARKNLEAARACLSELPEPVADFDEQVAALAQELDREDQEVQRLKEMEADYDLRTSTATRSLLTFLLGIIWTATSGYAALRYGTTESTHAEELLSYRNGGIRNMGIALVAVLVFRKRIFANAANRRLTYFFVSFICIIALLRWSTWALEESLLMSRIGEFLIAGLLLIAMGLVTDLRIAALSLFYFVAVVLVTYFPEMRHFARPVLISLTFFSFAYLWLPSQVDNKITLSTIGENSTHDAPDSPPPDKNRV